MDLKDISWGGIAQYLYDTRTASAPKNRNHFFYFPSLKAYKCIFTKFMSMAELVSPSELGQSDEPRYWRVLVTATSEFDIQGVNLREAICKRIKLPGQVSNIRGGVELIIYCSRHQAEETQNRIRTLCRGIHGGEEIPGLTIDLSDDKLFPFDTTTPNVSILRSDDLREMVWGLQGAGRVFQKQLEQKKHNCFLSLTTIIGYSIAEESSDELLQTHQTMLREILQETPFDEELTNWLFIFLNKMIAKDRKGLLELGEKLETETDETIKNRSPDYQELYRKMKSQKSKK